MLQRNSNNSDKRLIEGLEDSSILCITEHLGFNSVRLNMWIHKDPLSYILQILVKNTGIQLTAS